MEEKCLVCGGELEIDQVIDTEFDGDTIYAYMTGFCSKCDCPHEWTDVYKFSGTKDLKINEELLED